MSGIANYKNNKGGTGIVDVCVICEQVIQEEDEFRDDVMHNYTSEPCANCQSEINEGNYIFVLISDKSEEDKINRLGSTWVVEGDEVEKSLSDTDVIDTDEQIIFIRESEALQIGLLEERVSEESQEEEDKSEIIMPDDI